MNAYTDDLLATARAAATLYLSATTGPLRVVAGYRLVAAFQALDAAGALDAGADVPVPFTLHGADRP